MEYYQLKQAIKDLEIQKEKTKNETHAALAEFEKRKLAFDQVLAELTKQIELRKKEIIVLDDEILLESFALYKPQFKFQTSEEYKLRLVTCRDKQKQLIKNGIAVQANENWTVNNSKSEGKKMVNDMKKLLLRSFNNECDYCVDNVKFNNMEVNKKRIEKSYEQLNKLGRIMQANISDSYKNLKYEELYLAFEYQQKKQEEKEELKRAREELREQQKLEQEIRQAREKIAKEKKHYIHAINELEVKLNESTNEAERELVLKKLEEVKEQYSELEKEEKIIDYREQNAKAGYVYIISNIGAFGNNVYKIGMTRRLEPLDRVDELGDASVPFSFDVHALIFSENAPALEAKLHEHFYKNRINKLNNRKEFFRADIHEIEKIIKENYDKVVDVVKEAPAEQYRESLLVE
ncbi:MAG: ATPase [Anaerolineaceae bacterium]|nr:ATPase [Anaerolineaceae bacterium]